MTEQELETLLNDLESDRTERKESLSDTDKIRQAICAFANDLPNHRQPGVLFVGANDQGNGVGLVITERLLLTLADIRSDGNILPFPSMTVQKRLLKECEMAVVIVHPSDAPPVRFKGTSWIRVGPRRATATAQEERQLAEKRRFHDQPFDLRPAPALSLDVLDELLFRQVYLPSAVDAEVLAQNQRSLEHQLVSLRFAHPGPPACPTTLGLLVIGKSPTDFLPGAYVQFLRIDGLALTDPIKSPKELRGPLPQVLTDLDELFKVHISTATDITSQAVESRAPDYPIVALQQLARNAIMHRTYEATNAPIRITWFNDRIEIQNPGGPFGQVNRQNFGQEGATDYRNPHLAEAMKNLGYVQRFGVGIALARQEMHKNANPPPEFQVEDSHIAVILRRRP
jgi:ATP-dependent DNA helicase RecG